MVTPQQAEKLAEKLDSDICRVGVFVDQAPDFVAELLNSGVIQMAQLHGSEDRDYQEQLLARLKHPHKQQLIKAVRVKTPQDILAAQQDGWAYLLLDAGGGAQAGGNGMTFDWSILQKIPITTPFFLAGGLDADNVQMAIRLLHPFAVDVSSSVETDGEKDRNKVERFMQRVRSEH